MLPLQLHWTRQHNSAAARSLIARGPERVDQHLRHSLAAMPLFNSMLLTESNAITLRRRSASANCAVLAKIPAALLREQIDTVAPLLCSAPRHTVQTRDKLCA